MSNLATKPMMKRFEAGIGWSDAPVMAPVVSIHNNFSRPEQKSPTRPFAADALANLGDSIQDIFETLKISDPAQQSWQEVDIAIKKVGIKLQEKKQLENRLNELMTEIELDSHTAAELVVLAHKKEVEIHNMSKMRLDIAELLNSKLTKALKS